MAIGTIMTLPRLPRWVGAAGLAACLLNCSKPNKPVMSEQDIALANKRDLYCSLARPQVEARGSAVSRCDGLLFSSLHNIACGYPALEPFEKNGQWFRDPAHACGPNGKDGSTISKDMVTGLLLYAANQKDAGLMERFINYGKAHDWEIGAADDAVRIGTVIMSPNIVTLAYDVYNYSLGRSQRASLDEPATLRHGSEEHLEILSTLTKHVVNKSLSNNSLETLEKAVRAQPQNALFSAALKLYQGGTDCVDRLLDVTHWPSDHLPTNANHCTPYLYERDNDAGGRPDGKEPDWLSCDRPNEYDGTDFVFAATICLGEI